MKRKLIVLLLALSMMVGLFAGLSISAYAANDVSGDTVTGYLVSYTLKAGDTVSKVCNSMGVSFNKNQALITKVNNITDYSKLSVGKVIWLPAKSAGESTNYYTLKSHTVASGDTLSGICDAYNISSTDAMLTAVNGKIGTLAVGSVITVPVYNGEKTVVPDDPAPEKKTDPAPVDPEKKPENSSIAADTVAYYLIPYTMRSGDTVAKVCASLGINFSEKQSMITKINNITNYNTIPVGRTLLLPSMTAPTAGNCYSVMAHTLVSGDTMYKLCQAYGISYSNSVNMLKALNNSGNLSFIKAGQVVYIPVAGTASGSGVSSGTTGITSTSTTYYAISKDAATNGSFTVKVGGIEVNKIAAGKTVTIVANGNKGYVQDTVTVTSAADTTKVVTVSNNSFVMPEFDVKVSVSFKKAATYELTADATTNGSFYFVVDGADVLKAMAGATVKVATEPAKGYTVDKIEVWKTSDSTKTIKVSAENTFVMPSYAVTVKVTFKPGSDYAYTLNGIPSGDGVFDLIVNKVVVNKAKAGATVTVAATPNKGYKLDSVTLTYNSKTVTVKGGSFTMPAYDTDVEVNFIKSATYAITAGKCTNGSLAFAIGKTKVTKAEESRTIEVIATGRTGYEVDTIEVYKTGDPGTTVAFDDQTRTFDMPDFPVTVKATFQTYQDHSLSSDIDGDGTVEFTVKAVSGATDAKTGSVVIVDAVPDPGFMLKSIKVVGDNNENWTVKMNGSNFTMPDYDVLVKVVFVADNYAINDVTTDPNGAIDSFMVKSDNTVSSAKPGDTVTVNTTPTDGFKLKSITVTDAADDTKTVAMTGTNTFVMPDFEVNVKAEFKEGNYNITKQNSANGTYLVVAAKNDTDELTSAKKDVDFLIIPNENTGYEPDEVYITNNNGKDRIDATDNGDGTWSVTMPSHAIKVWVVFKEVAKEITINAGANGTTVVSANGTDLTSGDDVSFGEVVTISTKADDGYILDAVKVYREGEPKTLVDCDGTTFKMPAFNVVVEVEYRELAKDVEIKKAAVENGTVTFSVDGSKVNGKADEGDIVSVDCVPANGYMVDKITVITVENKQNVTLSGNTFVMPAKAVKVTVTFKLG